MASVNRDRAVDAQLDLDVLPPHSQDAEASILGAILLAEAALDQALVEAALRPQDFFRPRHQLIFRAMVALRERDDPEAVDDVTVCDELTRANELDNAGGREYVHSLKAVVPALGKSRDYARIVKRHSQSRALLEAGRRLQQDVLSAGGHPREQAERAGGELLRIAAGEGSAGVRSLREILDVELDKLEQLSRDKTAIGARSGFTELDRLLGGFRPGNLIVLAARPSLGKSALVTNIAENIALADGGKVLLFSLEMSEAELAQRFIASQAKVDSAGLRNGQVAARDWPKVVKAADQLSAAPIYVDESGDIGLLEIRAKARQINARDPLDLIVVDYLQLIRPEDTGTSRVEQVGQMSRGLKVLAREIGVPVIAVSQLSRSVEQRSDPRPVLSDLRESGQIEQDADVVIFIYRDQRDDDDSGLGAANEPKLLIAKHRNGPVGEVPLVFLPKYPKFATPAAAA